MQAIMYGMMMIQHSWRIVLLRRRNHGGATSAELRRQIHIQSEQKRRAQIKDGFDELRKHLPGCNNKKMSKAALLTRSKWS